MLVHSVMDRRKRKNDRPSIQPSSKVRKCLFGKATEDEKEEESRAVEQENLSNLENMKVKYGYDFVEEKHLNLENTQCTVAKVIEAFSERDVNGDLSVESVEERTTDPTTTPIRKCVSENASESDSKSSNGNSVNDTLNETDQNEESNCICEPDKAESNGQSEQS